MWPIVGGVVLVLATIWAIKTLTRKPGIPKQTTPLKNPKKHLKTEQILVACRYNRSHSTPQVATNGNTESAKGNDSIFAVEFETEGQINLGPEDELEVDQVPVAKDSEYGGDIALMGMIRAFGTLTQECVSPQERQEAAEVLEQLQGTQAMDQLKSEPRRAAKIDELINERFAQRIATKIEQSDYLFH